MERDAPLIFLIAGEPSGDLIASRLMEALKQRAGDRVRFAGIGGPLMAEQGLESLFRYSELSLMGLFEVVPHVPRMLGRIRATARTARRLRPAAFVSVDVPGFALRVARKLKGASFPLVHYVAPTVWAYRPGRAAEIARYLDHVLCLFPFEPPYFEAVGPGCQLRRPSSVGGVHWPGRRAGLPQATWLGIRPTGACRLAGQPGQRAAPARAGIRRNRAHSWPAHRGAPRPGADAAA